MSDAPLGPDWWLAGDGKWYPSPPGLADDRSSRAPTPAPDHDPAAPAPRPGPFSAGVYRAGRVGAPVAEEPPRRARRRALVMGALVAILVVALVAGISVAVSGHSSTRASSNDPAYQQAIVDLLDSESTNIVFLQTFWEGYYAHLSGGPTAPGSRGRSSSQMATVDAGWLDDMQSQVDQFSIDLAEIDTELDERPWSDGSVADRIRDLARDHYRTWQQWSREVPGLVRTWFATKSPLELRSYLTTAGPELDTAIEQSFHALCDELTDTAPADGRFDATIAGICQQ